MPSVVGKRIMRTATFREAGKKMKKALQEFPVGTEVLWLGQCVGKVIRHTEDHRVITEQMQAEGGSLSPLELKRAQP